MLTIDFVRFFFILVPCPWWIYIAFHRSNMRLFARFVATVNALPVLKSKDYDSPCAISALCREGRLREAIDAFRAMDQPIVPDVYASLLQVCANMRAQQEGKQLHAHVLVSGFGGNIAIAVKLVNMYAKCGSIKDSRLVFDKKPERNVLLWNAMIGGYARYGHCKEALVLYYDMQRQGKFPDNYTFPCVLRACAGLGDLQQGKDIHDYVIRSGLESDVYVENALIDMYAKCGSIADACHVFDKMSQRDLVSWNAIISGYAQLGHGEQALKLFRQMQMTRLKPDAITIASVLPACAHLAALQLGKEFHGYIIRCGFESNVHVASSLVAMYMKCKSIENARHVFDKMSFRDAVLWNAMIAGYGQNGQCHETLELFDQLQLAGMKPNSATIASVLSVCAQLTCLERGKEIHDYIIISGFESDVTVRSALIDMYAKCGRIEQAREVFDNMFQRDVVSWTAMIASYAQHGYGGQGLKLFCEMQLAGMQPDSVTIASVLPACADLAVLQQGKEIHTYIIRHDFESEIAVGSALVAMYAKCGSIEGAYLVFDRMSHRDIVSWNVMIAGYAMHGDGKAALEVFYQMQNAAVKPDHITFTAVLSACSHAGLVDEGLQNFDHMSQEYNITPGVEHYACLVDLLGRAGWLNEAEGIIKKMPVEPNASVWGALLGACRIHCNIELGERAAQHLFKLEPDSAANYVLLSNIYASAGKWEEVRLIRRMIGGNGLKKSPGYSWVEIKNRVHVFSVGDRSHPQTDEIYAMLENLAGQMKEGGYASDTGFVLYDVEEEEKEQILCYHSEKLAIAFGLINAYPRTPVRIFKNLRVCGDCHTAIKFISKMLRQEIIVRDASRFHHFMDGQCSCGDYW